MSNILLNFRGLSLQNVLGRFFNSTDEEERVAAANELRSRGFLVDTKSWIWNVRGYESPNRELS